MIVLVLLNLELRIRPAGKSTELLYYLLTSAHLSYSFVLGELSKLRPLIFSAFSTIYLP